MSRAAAGRKRMLKQALPPSATYETTSTSPSPSGISSGSFNVSLRVGKRWVKKEEKAKVKEGESVEEDSEDRPQDLDRDASFDTNTSSTGLSNNSSGSGSDSGSHYDAIAGSSVPVSSDRASLQSFIFPTSRSKARPRTGTTPTSVGSRLRLGRSNSAKDKKGKGRAQDDEPNDSLNGSLRPPKLRVITATPSSPTFSDFSGSGSALSLVHPLSPLSPSVISSADEKRNTRSNSSASEASRPSASTGASTSASASIYMHIPASPIDDVSSPSFTSPASLYTTPPNSPPASLSSPLQSPQSSPPQRSAPAPFVFPTSRSRGHPSGIPLPVKFREARQAARARRASQSGASGASSTTTEDVNPVVTTESSSASPPRARVTAAWTSTTTKWMGNPLNTVARKRNKNIPGPGSNKAKGKERVIPPPVIREDVAVIGYDNANVQASPSSSTLSHPFFASAHSPTLPSGSYYQDPSRASSHVSVSQWTQLSNRTHTTLAPEDSYSQMGKNKDRDSVAAREKFWEKTKAAYRKDTDDGDAIRGTVNRYSFSRRQSHHQDKDNRKESEEEEEYDDDWDDDDSFLERYEQGWIDDGQARYLSRSYSFRSFGTDEEGQAALERGWARQRDRERILKMKMERKSERKRRRGRRVEGYKEYGEEGEWEQFDYNYEDDDEGRDSRERVGAREKVEEKRSWRMGTFPFNAHDEALLDSDQHTHTLLKKLIHYALSDSSSRSPSTPSSSTPLSHRSVNTVTTNTPVNSSSYTLTPTPSSPSTPLSGSSPLSPARALSTSSRSTFHPTPSVVLGPPLPSPSFHNYGPHPPASVLDLGCGLHGLWAREAVNAWGGFGTRVVGMDLELELEVSGNDDVQDGKVAPAPNSEKVEQRIPEKARLHLTTEIAKGQASNKDEIDSPMRLVGGVIQGPRRDSPRSDEDDIRDHANVEDTKVESHSESPISSPKSLEFVKGNFVTSPLPFPSSSFDLVRIANLTYVIPYDKWESLLEEVCRVLTVGGRLEVVDDHVFFAYGKLEASIDNDGSREESRERRRESTFSGTTTDERSSYYFRHSLASSQYSTFTLTSPESSTPPSPSQNLSMADGSDSDPRIQEQSQQHQQHLEALYHYRYRQQSWKNRQTTARSLESLFEHLMNIKYGIHLCPSEFLEGLMERVMGFAKEVGSWHLLLVEPGIENDREEAQNVGSGVDRHGKSRKKDKVTSPAAAIASDFRSRSMAALITNLGLPEQKEDTKDGDNNPDAFTSGEEEDDSDSGSNDSNDVLKNSSGLILWPNKLLPLSPNEVQANVLNHCRALLACSEQLQRYAGELEVMKYRFERDEYRNQDKSEDGQEEDSDPDTEEERELEHEMRQRVEAEVKEALEEYRSFLHDRFNPPRPPPLLAAPKSLEHDLPFDDDRRSIETLHDNLGLLSTPYPQHVSSPIVLESPVTAVHVTTPIRGDFSHHSRNSSTTTTSSDDRSAVWEYQSELQDHISWTSEETKEDPPLSPTSPDTPRAYLQELEEENYVHGPPPVIGTPTRQSRFDLYNVSSSNSGYRAVSADRQVPDGVSDKKDDEPILVRTIHVYEGIKLDGSVLSIGSAI